MFQPNFWLLTLMVCIPAAMRLIQHDWNFAPVAAVALFAGAHFRSKSLAFLVPILAMFLSDLALGVMRDDMASYAFHPLLPITYGCYALSVCMGFGVRSAWNRSDRKSGLDGTRKKLAKAFPVLATALAGSIMFFVVTNFAYWVAFENSSLVSTYIRAIPFFRGTLAGDLVYSFALFGGYALLTHKQTESEQVGAMAE